MSGNIFGPKSKNVAKMWVSQSLPQVGELFPVSSTQPFLVENVLLTSGLLLEISLKIGAHFPV